MKRFTCGCLLISLIVMFTACAPVSPTNHGANFATTTENPNTNVDYSSSELKTIYFAGGCFWGVEKFMSHIYGVQDATSGYANGIGENPSYKDVIRGDEGFAETVKVAYDPARVSLADLISYFFRVIDPTSLNKQGNDQGIQYRTGIYYMDDQDALVIKDAVSQVQEKYNSPIVTEVLPLTNFFLAEEYHQDYLDKNPNGYCHIDLSILNDIAKSRASAN